MKQLEDVAEIEIVLHIEDMDPSDSFDDADTIQHIYEKARFSMWAWCCVEVKASYLGVSESEYLGACSYDGEADFKASGYYDDMRLEALHRLGESLKTIAVGVSEVEL
jgi:hypothetical protein